MFNNEIYKYNSIKENFNYYLKFSAHQFRKKEITFDIFVKKLSTRILIKIDDVMNILSKINYVKIDQDSEQIYNKMNLILKNFFDLDMNNKVEKIEILLRYIIVNRSYFRTNKNILMSLKKKLIYLIFEKDLNDKININVYYFIIFNLIDYSILELNKKYTTKFNKLDEIDYYLDNPDSNKIFYQSDNYFNNYFNNYFDLF